VKAFAYVTAVVLAVIGIGVGIVGGLPAASPTVRTFGHGLLGFSVAFPTKCTGSPHLGVGPGSVSYLASDCSSGYAALVSGVLSSDAAKGPQPSLVLLQTRFGPRIGIGSTTTQDGMTITSWSPMCGPSSGSSYSSCLDVLIVREDGVVWNVSAISPGSNPSVVEAFLKSFHPKSFRPASWGNLIARG
jgi:hypothetical protein